jgi:chromosomal replication initiation ATPase DnaA
LWRFWGTNSGGLVVGTLEALHEQHKARQMRIKRAAIKPECTLLDIVQIIAEPEASQEPEPEIRLNLAGMSTFDIFIHEICRYYNVRKLDILSQRKINKISDQRHMLAYMLYRMTSFTNNQIAPKMHRDPTTIGYAIKKIMDNLDAKMPEVQALETRIASLLEQRKAVMVSQ